MSYTDTSAQKKRIKKKEVTTKVQQVEVSLINGNTLVGELLKYSQDSIVIMNEQFGRMAFASEEIENYSDFTADTGNWDKSKYQAQYFLVPSARPVGLGNKYYTNFDIFANTFSFGLSENFSVSAGLEVISIFASRFPVVYVTPKLSLPLHENFYIGIGTTIFAITQDQFVAGGLTFSNLTVGSATANFTAGVGFVYSTEGSAEDPLIQLGFTLPLSKKISFVGESFLTTNIEGVYNVGLRIITKNNFVFDAGITRVADEVDGLGLPLLSFSIPL